MIKRWVWIPNKSLGELFLGAPIQLYKNKNIGIKKQNYESASTWSTYEWTSQNIYIDVEDEKIVCIRSYSDFFYKKENFIGMKIDNIIKLLNKNPDEIDEPVEYENGNIHIDYRFFSLGLHVDCCDGKAFSATCINYEE